MPFPNPDSQFKPGGPGGPGRPRSKPITDRLREKLEELGDDNRTIADALVDQWLEMVADGDSAALRELLARIEGKVTDHVQHEGGLTIRVEYADADEAAPKPPEDPP